ELRKELSTLNITSENNKSEMKNITRDKISDNSKLQHSLNGISSLRGSLNKRDSI
ncbi:hypothetical protein ACJMK2_044403, partial [Sinanodonta woodiana]